MKIYTTESHGRLLYQLSYYRGGKRERRSFADLAQAKREARIIPGDLARETGLTFGYLRYTDTTSNRVFVIVECLYGFRSVWPMGSSGS